MYAIIKTGGKQMRVSKDAVIDVELLQADIGSTVDFAEVLFAHDGSNAQVGAPFVSGFLVRGEVIENTVGPKEKSRKYTPRQHTQTQWGHRQHYTRLKITECGPESGEKSKKSAEPKAEKTAEPKAEKPKRATAAKSAEATAEKPKKAAPKRKTTKKEKEE